MMQKSLSKYLHYFILTGFELLFDLWNILMTERAERCTLNPGISNTELQLNMVILNGLIFIILGVGVISSLIRLFRKNIVLLKLL